MNTVTITDLKKHGTKSLAKNETTYLIVNSKPQSAIVPIKEYEMLLEAIEDIQDRKAIEERRNDPNISSDEFFNDVLK